MKRHKILVSLFLITILLLAACAPGATVSDEDAKPSTETVTSDTSTNPDATVVAEEKYAEEVVIAILGDTTNFDPHNGSGAPFIRMTKLTNTGLVEENETTGELIPAIATEWELLDPLTWKFTIRDDILFQNGELLTFEDIEFSFARIDAGTRKDISYIDNLEKLDDTHFLIHFNEPFITFPCELTGSGFSIISKESTDDNIIGCGPYKLVEHVSGDHIIFERFDGYFKGTPKTERLYFRIIPEDASRAIALETGEVDAAEEIALNDRSRIAENPDLKLVEGVMNSIEYIGLLCTEGPTADVRVRQALALATDKDELILAAYSGKGAPAHSFLGSVMQHLIDVDPDLDLARAQELMNEAGYANGVDISMLCSGTHQQLMAQVLQAQWKKIGVNLDIQPLENSTYSERVKSHDFQVYLYSSNSSNDEPLEFLEECWGEFGGNRVLFQDDRYDELYGIITSTLEEPARGDAIEEMQQIIADQVPFIPLAYPVDGLGIKNSVGGINLNIGRETIWYNIYKVEN